MGTRGLTLGIVVLAALMMGTSMAAPARAATPAAAFPQLSGPAFRPLGTSLSGAPSLLVASRGLTATYTHGPTVNAPVEVNGSLSFVNAEVESAVDPVTGYAYDLWMADYGFGGIGFARSTDSGHSFQPAFFIPGSEEHYDYFDPTNYTLSWDPAIAVSSDGIVYAAFMLANGTTNPAGSPYVAVSYDHGASFSPAVPVLIPNAMAFGDREFIAVGPDGTVYVTWNFAPKARYITFLCAPSGSCSYASGGFNLEITASHDHGQTWSKPTVVSPNYPRGGALEGPLVVGSNGEIFVAFDMFPTAKNYSLSPGQEWFTSSTDGGATWSAPVLLSGSYDCLLTTWWIETTIGLGASGTIYVSFDVETPTGDVGFVRYSNDNGVTWSPLIRITPDVDEAAHIMQVAPGENGVVYLGWLTNNATDGSWNVYVSALSTLKGTLSPPTLVSPLPGSPFWWPGDTIGMAYLGHGKVSLSWGSQVSLYGFDDGLFNAIVQYH